MTRKLNMENLVVLRSEDPATSPWEPIHQKDVPKSIRDPDVLGELLAQPQIAAQPRGSKWWYTAIRAPAQ